MTCHCLLLIGSKEDSLAPKARLHSRPGSDHGKQIARSRTGTEFARRTGIDLFHLRVSNNGQQHGINAYLNLNLH